VYQLVAHVKRWENVGKMLRQIINITRCKKTQVTLQANMDTVHLVTGAPVSTCVLFLTIANIFLHQKSGL